MGSKAQGEARERVGSGLDPKSRGIHGRTTSRVAWGNVAFGCGAAHTLGTVSESQTYILLCKAVAESVPFSLCQPYYWMLFSICIIPIIQHNYKAFKVKDTVFMPSVVHGAYGGAGSLLGHWPTVMEYWQSTWLNEERPGFQTTAATCQLWDLPLTSCEDSEVRHMTFLSFCFLVSKKGKPYIF